MKNYVVLFSVFMFLGSGCNSQSPSMQCNNDMLKEDVNAYYLAEKNKDWNKTYNYRYKRYKDNITTKNYKTMMAKNSEGWEFIGFEILSYDFSKSMPKVLISFIERPPKEHFTSKKHEEGEIKINAPSIWVCEDGLWKVYNAVSRFHLPMNKPMIK